MWSLAVKIPVQSLKTNVQLKTINQDLEYIICIRNTIFLATVTVVSVVLVNEL